jgi:hypothetical protein
MSDFRMTGGCQCGAVRYALLAMPETPCICHCRMCQKQTGNYFGAFADMEEKQFAIIRGKVAYFRSSDIGDRGFCRDCGTPLVYQYTSGARVAVALGSLDDPARLKPVVQYGVESRMPWFSELATLPATESGKNEGNDPEICDNIRRSNRQHPDHDTDIWPPQK